jgi:hypothetical protein
VSVYPDPTMSYSTPAKGAPLADVAQQIQASLARTTAGSD